MLSVSRLLPTVRNVFVLLAVLAFTLACSLSSAPVSQTVTVLPTKTPQEALQRKMTPSATNTPSVTITGDVWKRDKNGVARGSLTSGAVVEAWCDAELCYLQGADLGLTVFIGCTDQAPERGCRQKEINQ